MAALSLAVDMLARMTPPGTIWWRKKPPQGELDPADGSAWPEAVGDHLTVADVQADWNAPDSDILGAQRFERRRTMTLELVRMGYIPNTLGDIERQLTEGSVERFVHDYVPGWASVVGRQAQFVPATPEAEAALYNAISDVYSGIFASS